MGGFEQQRVAVGQRRYIIKLLSRTGRMTHLAANEWEGVIGANRASAFAGTAVLGFDALDFHHAPRQHNVRRLLKIYRNSRCFRFLPCNKIEALITSRDLELALTRSTLCKADLLDVTRAQPPHLDGEASLRVLCLNGRSRIEAAKGFLPNSDWRWAVDLYLADSTDPVQPLSGVLILCPRCQSTSHRRTYGSLLKRSSTRGYADLLQH